MATPAAAPRRIYQQRSKITSLPLYYEGFLQIKRARGKEIRYWTELRGTKLFFYGDKKQERYTESIDLQNMISVGDGCAAQKQFPEVIVTLENEEVHLKTETAEDAEEWKGFILTVVELSVPSCLALLPGQLIRLEEVMEKEAKRRESLPSFEDEDSYSTDLPSEAYDDVTKMPSCFHTVTRQEAADMLLKMPNQGSLILRPGADSKNYAVTIREPSETAHVKHYRILDSESGYTIELEKPVKFSTLDDVVEYFIKETRGKLKPFITDLNMYEAPFDSPVQGIDAQKRSQQINMRPLLNHLPQNTKTPFHRGNQNTYVNCD